MNRLGLTCKPPLGSFYIYANVSGLGRSSVEIAKLLAKEGRMISYPGTAFTTDRSGEQYLRFAYTKDMAVLKTGLERIEEVVAKL